MDTERFCESFVWAFKLAELGMPDVERYRGYAAECLRLAQAITDQNARARLLQMAEAWRKLADDAEQKQKKLES